MQAAPNRGKTMTYVRYSRWIQISFMILGNGIWINKTKENNGGIVMKRLHWIGLIMLASVVLLTGCNQGEEQMDKNTEEQDSESVQETEQLISAAESFINQLNEGNYEEATENFDETMSKQVTPDDLEEVWVTLQSQIGNFIAQEYKSIEEIQGHQVVLITGVFNDAEVTFRVTFDEDQKVAGFFVQ